MNAISAGRLGPGFVAIRLLGNGVELKCTQAECKSAPLSLRNWFFINDCHTVTALAIMYATLPLV